MFPYSSLLVAVRDLGENPSFHSKPQMFRKKLGKNRAGLTMHRQANRGTIVRISSHAQCVHLSSDPATPPRFDGSHSSGERGGRTRRHPTPDLLQ
jgi:hypothetical protein